MKITPEKTVSGDVRAGPFYSSLVISIRFIVRFGMASTTPAATQTSPAAPKPVFAPGLFKDFVFVITGGGTGIGKAVALEAVQLGAKVALCGRRQPPLSDAANELAKYTSPEKIFFETCAFLPFLSHSFLTLQIPKTSSHAFVGSPKKSEPKLGFPLLTIRLSDFFCNFSTKITHHHVLSMEL